MKEKDTRLLAKKYFEDKGYSVRTSLKEGRKGVDIYVITDDNIFSVEVKQALMNKRKDHTGCWFVPPVSQERIHDDLIAIVLPNQEIIIEQMKDHLAACSKNGEKYIITLIRALCK